jgi:hypothetical protein
VIENSPQTLLEHVSADWGWLPVKSLQNPVDPIETRGLYLQGIGPVH